MLGELKLERAKVFRVAGRTRVVTPDHAEQFSGSNTRRVNIGFRKYIQLNFV